MNNKRITYSVRKEIEFILSKKDNKKILQKEIAYMLNISRSSLSKELKRSPYEV